MDVAPSVRKLAARNGVAHGRHTVVRKVGPASANPVLARKALKFVANNPTANRADAQVARVANPAMAPRARKPVARGRRTAATKAGLSRIAVTGVAPARGVLAAKSGLNRMTG